MKPFPKALQERYPCAPKRMPERPWWGEDAHARHPHWRRVDGREAYDPDLSDLSNIDEAHPIPHPGFRVGQTWAWTSGLPDGRILGVATILEHDPDGESGPKGRAHWLLGDAWLPRKELKDLLLHGFLLSDVVCPHLAPWAHSCGEK